MMRVVYEAAAPAEAYMIKHMLEQSGIEATVEGEHLQGGFSGLPGAGQARVVVSETDETRARELIREWEREEKILASQRQASPAAASRWLLTFFLGLLLGAGAMYAYYFAPLYFDDNYYHSVDTDDLNNDGEPDEQYRYEWGSLIEFRKDHNFDGEWDEYVFYEDGRAIEARQDMDFNGTLDSTWTYVNGVLTRLVSDFDGDEKVNVVTVFENGYSKVVKLYDEQTHRLRKEQHFDELYLKFAHFDRDGDGEFDETIHYDYLGEITHTTPVVK